MLSEKAQTVGNISGGYGSSWFELIESSIYWRKGRSLSKGISFHTSKPIVDWLWCMKIQ